MELHVSYNQYFTLFQVAFRPRHKTFHRSRRRNDVGSLKKLREIRSGLERLQMILELVRRRERLKEEKIIKVRTFDVFYRQVLADRLVAFLSSQRYEITQSRLQHLFRKASRIAAGEDVSYFQPDPPPIATERLT